MTIITNPRLTDEILVLEALRLRDLAKEYADDAAHSLKQASIISTPRGGRPGNLRAAERYRQQAATSRQCAALYTSLAEEVELRLTAPVSFERVA